MFYEINVSLHGTHFFATDKRSITDREKLRKILPVFIAKFPPEEGYEIMLSVNYQSGKILHIETFLNS